MPALAQALRTRLFGKDTLAGVSAGDRPNELTLPTEGGILWNIFPQINARLVIEVGCWRGGGAAKMAEYFRRNNIDGAVICVDTWLGGLDHYDPAVAPEWSIAPYMQAGYPALYHQFVANLTHLGLIDYIVPIPNTSLIGARWLAKQGIQADFIYVDASHEHEDVLADMKAYWPLLRYGGVFAGDDFHAIWAGVISAVVEFFETVELPYHAGGVNNWFAQKTISRKEKQMLDMLVQQTQAAQQPKITPNAT